MQDEGGGGSSWGLQLLGKVFEMWCFVTRIVVGEGGGIVGWKDRPDMKKWKYQASENLPIIYENGKNRTQQKQM